MMRKNRGFSLIELVVVIAIMTIFTGAITPAFMKYITNKRQSSCKLNREAILNVYEKCIYGGYINLSDTDADFDFKNFVQTSTLIPDDYKSQFELHSVCSDGGAFSLRVENGIAYCVCSSHDQVEDECAVDLVGWDGMKEQLADAELPFSKGDPGDESQDPDPEDEEPNSPEEVISSPGYWPYSDHPRWGTDSTAGYYGDSYVEIAIPSGKFAARTKKGGSKVYYVAIAPEGKSSIKIYRHSCENPEDYTLGAGNQHDSAFLVPCTGVELSPTQYVALLMQDSTAVNNPGNSETQEYKQYNSGSFSSNDSQGRWKQGDRFTKVSFEVYYTDYLNRSFSEYCTTYGVIDDADPKYDYYDIRRNRQMLANFGDIVLLENGERYIYGHPGQEYAQLPGPNCTSKQYGNWYKLAPVDEL